MNSIINLISSDIPRSFVEVKKDGATFDVPLQNIVLAPTKVFTLPASAYDLTIDLSSTDSYIVQCANGAGYTVNISLTNPVVGKAYTIIFKQGSAASTITITNTVLTLTGSTPFATSDDAIQKGTVIYDGVNWLFELSDVYA
jgi:hypothetical protein